MTLTDVLQQPQHASDPGPAARLRHLSGLDAARLATLFGVSRVTYQNWVAHGLPRGTHGEQLLQVLALVEAAAQRLGSPTATREWLLTPLTSQGARPLDYLQQGRYDLVRGFLLRLPTGRERPRSPTSPPRVPPATATRHRADALDLLRPRLWQEDDEPTPPTAQPTAAAAPSPDAGR